MASIVNGTVAIGRRALLWPEPRTSMKPRSFSLLLLLAQCTPGVPPTPDGDPSVARPEWNVAQGAVDSSTATTTATTTTTTTTTTTATTSPTPATSTASALLPQTHDAPASSGQAFDTRVAGLWAAIVKDDPSLAMPFFFPLDAYRQVKDVADPAADWNHRLVAAYRHDIHELHAKIGDAASARLVGLIVPDSRAKWVEPGEEYNKIGYFRVFGSKLRYASDGGSGAFDVKSLISWRGEWFVVHLSAIR